MIGTYNPDTGEIVTLASGVRMWIGTKSAHDIAVLNGKMPNNVMVCITDDYVEIVDNTANLSGIENVTTLNANSWQARQGFITFGEIVLKAVADISPSTPVASGLIPSFSLNNYGQHWATRGVVNGVLTMIPVYINDEGLLILSNNAPTLHSEDSVLFNATYRGAV